VNITPALFIKTCTAGVASAIAAARTLASDVRLTGIAVVRAPPTTCWIHSPVSFNPSGLRPASTTCAPAAASARADSLPRPDVAPAITQTLSLRSMPSTICIAVGRACCSGAGAFNGPSLRR
jgi:hypothetical protein